MPAFISTSATHRRTISSAACSIPPPARFCSGLQRWHRALLRRVLEGQGFTVNPSEWWHFDFHGWARYPILNAPFEELPRGAAPQDSTRYTHADTLRGSNGPARAWWDVQFHDLHTRVNPRDSSISGWNGITYRVLQPARELQIA